MPRGCRVAFTSPMFRSWGCCHLRAEGFSPGRASGGAFGCKKQEPPRGVTRKRSIEGPVCILDAQIPAPTRCPQSSYFHPISNPAALLGSLERC